MTSLGAALRAAAAGDETALRSFGLDDLALRDAVDTVADTGPAVWSTTLLDAVDDGIDPLAALTAAGAPTPVLDDAPIVAGAEPIPLSNDTSLDDWAETVDTAVDPVDDGLAFFGDDDTGPVFGLDDTPDDGPLTQTFGDVPADDPVGDGIDPDDTADLWDTGTHDLDALLPDDVDGASAIDDPTEHDDVSDLDDDLF